MKTGRRSDTSASLTMLAIILAAFLCGAVQAQSPRAAVLAPPPQASTDSPVIPDGTGGTGNIPKAAYVQQCLASLKSFNVAPTGPAGAQTLNPTKYPESSLGCKKVGNSPPSADLYGQGGATLMNNIFQNLSSGSGNIGLLFGTRECFNTLGQGVLTERVEVYTGRNIAGKVGDGGVSNLAAGNYESVFVLPTPNIDFKLPLAGITVGRNIFLSAAQGDLGLSLLPSVPTNNGFTSAVSTFTSNKAVRANLALLHGLYLVQKWATTYGQDATNEYTQYFKTLANNDCRIEKGGLIQDAYGFVASNAASFLCCLKTQQIGGTG